MAGAAIGAIAGAGISSGLSFLTSKALQEDAQQFQTNFYKNRYQRQMEDMRKAGLNPILSYRTGAPGSGGAGIASQGTAAAAGTTAAAATDQATSARGVRGQQKKLFKEQLRTEASKQILNNMQAGQASALAAKTDAEAVVVRSEHPAALHRQRFYSGKHGGTAIKAQEVGTSAKSIWSPFIRAK